VKKAIGLEKYIKDQNQKGQKLIGGIIEIRKVSGTISNTMLINKVGNYNLDNRSDFVSFGDEFIKNYDFSQFEIYSKKYIEELKQKISELEDNLKLKKKELLHFIESEKNSGDFDYVKREEIESSINSIQNKIKNLKKNIGN
ncbi:MAG: hypothetical protein NWP80_01035, partial [Candidatus Gracilibacteria bacterium]|nr:hypothetical protein [Candidatus Gracilibacteria bacterium]